MKYKLWCLLPVSSFRILALGQNLVKLTKKRPCRHSDTGEIVSGTKFTPTFIDDVMLF